MDKLNISTEELLAIIARQFFRFRKELNYSLDEIASHTGLSVKTLDDLECGRNNPDIKTLLKLLDFYRPFAR